MKQHRILQGVQVTHRKPRKEKQSIEKWNKHKTNNKIAGLKKLLQI